MANGPVARLTHLLEQAAPSDDDLLSRFVEDTNGEAFAELVRRHGATVLGACRRITGDRHHAEDAFQVTFLVLARKAKQLIGRGPVGGWLYGVARRAALKTRERAARHRQREAAGARPEAVAQPDCSPDWLAVVEEEVGHLPEQYRGPLVLCGVCGESRKDAAAQLGIPEGTLASRLATARELLAKRLQRRGVSVPAFALIATAIPPSLAEATVALATASRSVPLGVANLTSEVIRMMLFTKLRAAAALVFAALAGAAALAVAATGAAGDVPAAEVGVSAPAKPLPGAAPPVAQEKPPPVTLKELTKQERDATRLLKGKWTVTKRSNDGKTEKSPTITYDFGDRVVSIRQERNGRETFYDEYSFAVNPTLTPPEMTIYQKGVMLQSIYELNGDSLKIAHLGLSELERPRSFDPRDTRVKGMPLIMWELKRAEK